MTKVIVNVKCKKVSSSPHSQVNHMFEVEDLRDEPVSFDDPDPLSYGHLKHYYTKDLVLKHIRSFSWIFNDVYLCSRRCTTLFIRGVISLTTGRGRTEVIREYS